MSLAQPLKLSDVSPVPRQIPTHEPQRANQQKKRHNRKAQRTTPQNDAPYLIGVFRDYQDCEFSLGQIKTFLSATRKSGRNPFITKY
jgi:hypothetical protein